MSVRIAAPGVDFVMLVLDELDEEIALAVFAYAAKKRAAAKPAGGSNDT